MPSICDSVIPYKCVRAQQSSRMFAQISGKLRMRTGYCRAVETETDVDIFGFSVWGLSSNYSTLPLHTVAASIMFPQGSGTDTTRIKDTATPQYSHSFTPQPHYPTAALHYVPHARTTQRCVQNWSIGTASCSTKTMHLLNMHVRVSRRRAKSVAHAVFGALPKSPDCEACFD